MCELVLYGAPYVLCAAGKSVLFSECVLTTIDVAHSNPCCIMCNPFCVVYIYSSFVHELHCVVDILLHVQCTIHNV